MKSPKKYTRKQFRLENDTLESRCVPATFGIPWSNPSHITVSFAPDGVDIYGKTNVVNQSLGTSDTNWKSTLLEAFQIWSSQTNINFTVVNESGNHDFGVDGSVASDPRFGDIRIGAVPLSPEVLAVTQPFSPSLKGTGSGDIIFNSNYELDHDALLSAALHEIGHSLGLDNSSDSSSVMFNELTPHANLSQADLNSLQSLYGIRVEDVFDNFRSNDSTSDATNLKSLNDFNGQIPTALFGDLTSDLDQDYYFYKVPGGYEGSLTLTVKSSGISLLNGTMEVIDSSGNVVGSTSFRHDVDHSGVVTLNHVTAGEPYTILVHSTDSKFDIGSYGLAVSIDGRNQVPASTLNEFLSGANLGLSSSEISQFLKSGEISEFDSDDDSHRSLGSGSFDLNYQSDAIVSYSAFGKIKTANDTDQLRLHPLKDRGSVLTVRVASMGSSALNPLVSLRSSNGQVIPSQILINDGNSMIIQSIGLSDTQNVIVHVGSEDGSTGNYRVEAYFGSVASNLRTFLNTTISGTSPIANYQFLVAESQIFQFSSLITSNVSYSGSQVIFDVIDSNGQLIWSHTGQSGLPTSGSPLFLASGSYVLQVRLVNQTSPNEQISITLFGDTITDPIGPGYIDASTVPDYTNPSSNDIYSFPGGINLDSSYIIYEIIDPLYDPYVDYGYIWPIA